MKKFWFRVALILWLPLAPFLGLLEGFIRMLPELARELRYNYGLWPRAFKKVGRL